MTEIWKDVTITEVVSPGELYGKEVPGVHETEETRDFHNLSEIINKHYDRDQHIPVCNYHPGIGTICVGRRVSNQRWYRVRIKENLVMKHGIQSICFLIDHGITERIPNQWIRPAREAFLDIPAQVKTFKLYGLKPLTLTISSEDLQTSKQMSEKWDISAIEYMKRLIKEVPCGRFLVKYKDSSGTLHGDLILRSTNFTINVNTELVNQDYAVRVDDTGCSDSADNIRLLHRGVNAAGFHDKETNHPSGYASDPGQAKSSEQLLSPGRHIVSDTRSPNSREALLSQPRLSDEEFFMLSKKNQNNMMSHGELDSIFLELNPDRPDSTRGFSEIDSSNRRINMSNLSHSVDREVQSSPNKNSVDIKQIDKGYNSDTISSSVKSRAKKSFGLMSLYSALDQEIDTKNSQSPLASASATKISGGNVATARNYLGSTGDNFGQQLTTNSSNAAAPPRLIVNKSENDSMKSMNTAYFEGNKSSLGAESMSSPPRKSRTVFAQQAEQSSRSAMNTQSLRTSPNIVHHTNIEQLVTEQSPVPSAESQRLSLNHYDINTHSGETSQTEFGSGAISKYSRQAQPQGTRQSDSGSDSDFQRLMRGDKSAPIVMARLPKIALQAKDRSTSSKFARESIMSPPSSRSMELARERIPTTTLQQGMLTPSSSITKDAASPGLTTSPRLQADTISAQIRNLSVMSVPEQSHHRGSSSQNVASPGSSPRLQHDIIYPQIMHSPDLEPSLRSALIAESVSKNILTELTVHAPRARRTTQQSNKMPDDSGVFGVCYDNILVHGLNPLKPTDSMSSVDLAELVKQKFRQDNITEPNLVQAYCWPNILRGRDLVAISPTKSGKTLAYLAPLLTQLFQPSIYSNVMDGAGPLCLILLPSWKTVQSVYDECYSITQDRKHCRVLAIYGGGSETNQVTTLLNGCEVLVATPSCLLRMLNQGYTDLDRLCHLVIDDAEVMVEQFTEQIQSVMSRYAQALEAKKNRSVPRQILLMGNQWTPGVESFCSRFMPEPLFILTSRYEAAVYGNVKEIVYVVKSDQRVTCLMGLLDSIPSGNKTIIFTSQMEDANQLQKLLSASSIYALVATSDPSSHQLQLDQVAQEWHEPHAAKSQPLLICMDACTAALRIHDATIVVHYDIPDSITKFGNRLSCMKDYYRDFTSKEKVKVIPVSHILITEKCRKQAYPLLEMLKRVGASIPDELQALVAGIQMGREENTERVLCPELLAFGRCKKKNRCIHRHVLLDEDVAGRNKKYQQLPRDGEVKMLITHIDNASHYFMRFLEIRPMDGSPSRVISDYADLVLSMGQWYGAPDRRVPHGSPSIGGLYGIEDEQSLYHRILVKDIIDEVRLGSTIHARVMFVDIGREDCISAKKLLLLPEHLQAFPYQAVEVYLCRVQPIDDDTEWTPRANLYICDLLSQTKLDGKVVLSLGNTLWLDPLVERQYLSALNCHTNHIHVRLELLRNGLALDNPEHMLKLYEICKEKMDIPKALIQKYMNSREMLPDTESFLKNVDFHDIFVSAVDTPDVMFVQKKEWITRLDDMMTAIDKAMSDVSEETEHQMTLRVKSLCLAKFTQDERWYRAQVLALLEDGSAEVFYVDYGDKETVGKERLRAIPEKFQQLSFQAIECQLANVTKIGDCWNDIAGDALWDMTRCLNGDQKLVVGKVESTSNSEYAGEIKYSLELFDTSTATDRNLAQELVWRRLANGDAFTALFPKPSIGRKTYKQRIEKIPDLCAAIYWEENPVTALKLTKEMLKICSTISWDTQPATLKYHDILETLLTLMEYTNNCEVIEVLLKSLLQLVADGNFCEEMLIQKFVKKLVHILDIHRDTEFQASILTAVEEFSRNNSLFPSYSSEYEVLDFYMELIKSTSAVEIQRSTISILADICAEQASVCQYIGAAGICEVMSSALKASTDHGLVEVCLGLLATMSESTEMHNHIKRKELLTCVILKLEASTCQQCIFYAVSVFKHLSEASRKNITLLLELGVVPVLSSVVKGTCTSNSKCLQFCEDLLKKLAIKFPQSGVIDAEMYRDNFTQENHQTGQVRPQVSWTQTSMVIQLSVKIRGARKEDVEMRVEEASVHFNAPASGTHYAFDYALFDTIIPAKCYHEVRGSEIAISLRKVEKGRWPRLLKEKTKLATLTVDFDRFVNSSSESDDCEEAPFSIKTKPKRCFPKRPVGFQSQITIEKCDKNSDDSSGTLSPDVHEERDRFSDPWR